MRILIRGGRILDPGNLDCRGDILIEDGRIAAVNPQGRSAADRVIDASGLVVTPGLIDLHVHFREPGQEYKETVASGCRAAAWGGFTSVCTMPNTDPPNDTAQTTLYILKQAEMAGGAKVFPVGTISRGLKGEQLSEFGELKAAGAVAVSDDGMPVISSQMMRRALEYARGIGLLVISHSEELSLSSGGAMNEGETATRLGLPGIPNAAESIAVMRDIALAELTEARLHIAHVSTAESVRAIREAKKRGVPVTAETAPHYFTLTDEAVEAYDTHAKMNPPLRSAADREAIRQGLTDGTIDAIATDHAPHTTLEKNVEFDRAANGIIGLETSLPVGLRLVTDGVLTLAQLIEKMSLNPARILGMDNRIREGNPADLTIIDPDRQHTIHAERFQSLSRNCPFDGWEMTGRAVMTIVGGTIVFDQIS